jgi:L-fuconolactonase
VSAPVRWRQDWGRPVREPALDPDRPLIDPHHHLWPDRQAGTVPAGPYLARDLLADLDCSHRVVATVAIEAGAAYRPCAPAELAPVGESAFLAGQAAALAKLPGAPPLAGVVAHADLRLGARVEGVLDEHEAASVGLLRGIRQMGAFHPPASLAYAPSGLYADAGFREGIRRLGARGLTFDAWHFHPQARDFAELVRACPDTTFVLDHFGTPLGVGDYAGRREAALAEWRAGLAELAALPNLVVKASGFWMWMTGSPWRDAPDPPTSEEAANWARPVFEALVEAFGPQRLMFASNFPVDKTAIAYGVLWNAFKTLARGLSQDETDALCRGTAARTYKLETSK